MATSVITSPFRFLSNLIAPINHRVSNSGLDMTTSSDGVDIASQSEKGGKFHVAEPNFRSTASKDHVNAKRKAVEDDYERPFKRRAMYSDRPSAILYDEEDDSNSSRQSPTIKARANENAGTKAERDRTLMPPPATPHRGLNQPPGHRLNPAKIQASRDWTRDDDSASYVSTTITRRRVEDADDEMMEAARRHAAAVTLPANSGIWSQTERELFFHLAYRGFEPLLPQNWMIDFDTLPLSVFSHENTIDPPLIQNIRDNPFRAGHALRRLFEAGHDVRDRNHVSPGVRREKTLEQAVKRYLYWALTDVGLRPTSKTSYTPVHVVVKKRKDQTTFQTLEEIAKKLHHLSEQHQQARDVRPSIEIPSPGTKDADETRIADANASSPTIIGLVIVSSVLIIVTLSPFSNLPVLVPPVQTASPPNSDPSSQPSPDCNPDRLRIIAELDFSQRDQDVWNALGVAIVAMQIRREALRVNYGFTDGDLTALNCEDMSNTGSTFEGEITMSRLDLDDDPDL